MTNGNPDGLHTFEYTAPFTSLNPPSSSLSSHTHPLSLSLSLSHTMQGLIEIWWSLVRASAPLLFTTLSLLIGVLIYFYSPYWALRNVPGPPTTPLLGHLPLLTKYGPDVFAVLAKRYGPIYRYLHAHSSLSWWKSCFLFLYQFFCSGEYSHTHTLPKSLIPDCRVFLFFIYFLFFFYDIKILYFEIWSVGFIWEGSH